jgi:predicted RNase H-like nuclease (RuvC/YqgF family)
MMADQNKYINGYIDNAVGMIHENVNLILQLKTQLRMANELISEKDIIINNVSLELENKKNNSAENDILVTKLTNDMKQLRATNESMISKQSHIDIALNQISQMKAQIIERDKKIVMLEESIKQLKNPGKKKAILNKVIPIQPPTIKKLATDDF